VTEKWIDRKVQCDGFASAMVECGWLTVGIDGIEFPKFDRHNGETAKQRGLATGRKKKQRGSVTQEVTDMSRNDRDNSVTREEKRRDIEQPPSVGATAPDPDPIFGGGLSFLMSKGCAERGARSFLGAMRKKCGDLLAAELLAAAEREDVSDPIPWLRKAYERRTGPPAAGPSSKAGQAITKLEGMKSGNQRPYSESHATLALLGPGIPAGK
jgi:hypothetical protein